MRELTLIGRALDACVVNWKLYVSVIALRGKRDLFFDFGWYICGGVIRVLYVFFWPFFEFLVRFDDASMCE